MKAVLVVLLLIGLISAAPLSNIFTLVFQYTAREVGDFLDSIAIVSWNN